ncbi:hypothetical protein QWM81_26160 [Streptomyces ficellus]|uniref:ABC transporter permease n=1 Tax=Streptomyces ficellus TaxID=1977088 RepID=A0ABT7ZD80_9ACTN|nr:hypothetical protein [Streptomyces ficellus]MDN3297459.1 hypothetical protein [Streptomyces ficellus]
MSVRQATDVPVRRQRDIIKAEFRRVLGFARSRPGDVTKAVESCLGDAAFRYVSNPTIFYGVLVATQEYSSRSIVHTLIAEPRRRTVYLGKLAVGLLVAFLYSLASVGLCVVVTVSMLVAQDESPQLGNTEVLKAIAGSVVVLTAWGALGVGIGALVRRQVPAIVGILVVNQFVEPLIRLAVARTGNPELGALLPGGAGDAASGGTIVNKAGDMSAPSPAVGFMVLCLYVLVLVFVGGRRFIRYQGT